MTRTSPVWVQECGVIYLRIPVNALSFIGQLLSGLALDTVSVGIETSFDLTFWELFPGEQK